MIRLKQIKVEVEKNNLEEIVEKILPKNISYKIKKRSIDARKEKVYYVYEIEVKDDKLFSKIHWKEKEILEEKEYKLPEKKERKEQVIIVGSGPAGLFSGYYLALAGYHPIIIEQGDKIENRVKVVEEFFEKNILNPWSNVQFGEGGAGTFSDGKLNTTIKDKEGRKDFILKTFIECGASKEIEYVNNPHIGTDILRKVIINLRKKMESLGCTFLFQTRMTDIIIEEDKVIGIIVNENKKIACDILLLAIGNSSRKTFELLKEKGLFLESKPFSVGVRVEHKQEMINQNQYKEFAKYLEPASYKLTYQTKRKRGVYSFCMCPGGYAVNASSEQGRLVINGMSNYKRESENANSAIVVTVNEKDYGNNPLDGMFFQQKLEEKTYQEGNGMIPIQRYIDFKNNQKTKEIGNIKPIVKGKYTYGNLRNIFNEELSESIIEAMEYFQEKIKGFSEDDVLLLGTETRTSSPVRILRNGEFECNIKRIYPCGEGSGYAGGITSSAIDGLKIAEKIISL